MSDHRTFDKEAIKTLLVSVLDKDDLPENFDGPRIAGLIRYLNDLSWLVASWRTSWTQDESSNICLSSAIADLTREIPKVLPAYVVASQASNTWNIPEFAEQTAQAQLDLQALNELLASAQNALARGLPLKFTPFAPAVEQWPHFASNAETHFHLALPGRSKAAGYRFIQEITKILTGDSPSLQGIMNRLTRKRPVNRGKLGRPLTRGKVRKTLLQ